MNWTVSIDGNAYAFPLYPSRRKAVSVARRFQRVWPNHIYRAVRAP